MVGVDASRTSFEALTPEFQLFAGFTPALGVIDDLSAGPCPSTRIREGDYLVCVTDGVTEAPNANKDLYGEDRVKVLVRSLAREGASPAVIVERIREDVAQFRGSVPARSSSGSSRSHMRPLGRSNLCVA